MRQGVCSGAGSRRAAGAQLAPAAPQGPLTMPVCIHITCICQKFSSIEALSSRRTKRTDKFDRTAAKMLKKVSKVGL